jgi:GDP-4-dehydro-6-deoxy-D-mannose reductase
MTEALITGANGFIGKSLTRHFNEINIPYKEVEKSKFRIEDYGYWENLPRANFLIHLAGRSFVPESWTCSSEFIKTNVIGTQGAIDYCLRHKCKLIFASAYVYGPQKKLPILENYKANPNNYYSLSKFLAEELCKFNAIYKGLDVTILRLFNVFGAGQRKEFLIPSIIEQMKNNNVIYVQDLLPSRDYIFVEDVVRAFSKIILKNLDGFHCINIGSGIGLSVKEVINVIQKVTNKNLQVISLNQERENEILNVISDISCAKSLIDWSPSFKFEDAIRKILKEEK